MEESTGKPQADESVSKDVETSTDLLHHSTEVHEVEDIAEELEAQMEKLRISVIQQRAKREEALQVTGVPRDVRQRRRNN